MVRLRGAAPARVRRPLAVVLLALGFVLGIASAASGQSGDGPLVDVVEIEGVIDQTIADYLDERVVAANRDGAEVVVIQLDTPGGLGVSMEEIVGDIEASRVPVVVWVGPPGAQAASAGTFIAMASHVLAVAPATLLGAATPVDLGGGDLDDKITNAAEGRLEGLAAQRGRNEDFARRAVRDAAVVVTVPDGETEAPEELRDGVDEGDVEVLTATQIVDQGIAEIVASTLPDVLSALDGRTVAVAAGDGGTDEVTLDVDAQTAQVRFHNLGLVRRVLHTVANPTLAYLLLIGGALALLFEVFQPGFGVAGATGVVLLGLGFYGLSVLPVSWVALALIVLGLAMLAADLAVAGLGVLTAGGTIALAVGSFLLFTGPELLRISPWLIGGVVAWNLLFFVVVMTQVLRAQGNQALVGAESLAGKVGVVRSVLNPEGHVFVDGALWRARAPETAGRVATGSKVRVVGLNDRLTLDVELVDEPTSVAG